LNNEELLIEEALEHKNIHNINALSTDPVAIFDIEIQKGYHLKISAQSITDHKLITHAETRLSEFGIQTKPKKVWVLTVKEIFSLEPSPRSRYPWPHYT